MNKRILLILLLLLTVLFSIPFWLKKEKNKELKIEKIEVIDEYIVGTRPVRKAKQIRSKYAIALDNMNKDMREIDPLCGKEWLIAYKDIVSKFIHNRSTRSTI